MLLALLLAGCVRVPDSVRPVERFDVDRYLGQWYEIARLDHSFERGLTHVTATYSLRDDGGVSVLNRGFSQKKGRWDEASGKAYFVESPDQGFLKVSFFGPFYGAYVIFELDQDDYQYSLVSGPNKSYLWLLARTPEIDPELRDKLLQKASAAGFDVNELIFVDQQGTPGGSAKTNSLGAGP